MKFFSVSHLPPRFDPASCSNACTALFMNDAARGVIALAPGYQMVAVDPLSL